MPVRIVRCLCVLVVAGCLLGPPSARRDVSAETKPVNPCEAEVLAAALAAESDQFAGNIGGTAEPAPAASDGLNPLTRFLNRHAPPMLFSDDFEATGDVSRWRRTDTLVPDTESGGRGTFAVRGVGTPDGLGTYARKRLDRAVDDVFFRISFRVLSQGPNPVDLLSLRSGEGRNLMTVFVDQTGALALRDDVLGTTATGATRPAPNAWHALQLHATYDQGRVRTALWLDGRAVGGIGGTVRVGQSDANVLTLMRNSSGAVVGWVELGDSESGRTYDVAFDDVIVAPAYVPDWRVPDPVPGTLAIQTAPPIAGVVFRVDGHTATTDATGRADLAVDRWSSDLMERVETPDSATGSGALSRFQKWYGWTGVLDKVVYAAVGLRYPARWDFVDRAGAPVDPALVTNLTFKSSIGVRFSFGPNDPAPHLLPGSRIAPSTEGLENKDIYYTLEYACVGGTNVVNRAQQKFFPSQSQDWTIQLLFYSASIATVDGLFGFPLGSAVEITYPDGTIVRIPVKDGAAYAPALPRGEYQMRVIGPGYSPPRPVTITRDQEIELMTVSYVDMGTAVGLVGMLALGLLLYGRPGVVTVPARYVRRKVRRGGLPA